MTLNKYDLLKNEYIEWFLTDKHQRALAGMPTSDTQWSKIKGISDRTLRLWKQDPDFVAKLENRRKEKMLSLPGATVLATTATEARKQPNPTFDPEKADHDAIKAKLIERAMAGDRASAELYFKTYGKQYVDEELASRKSDFRDMDIEALYERVLSLVPEAAIEAELAKRRSVPVPGDDLQ
jgi:hypothetical protein